MQLLSCQLQQKQSPDAERDHSFEIWKVSFSHVSFHRFRMVSMIRTSQGIGDFAANLQSHKEYEGEDALCLMSVVDDGRLVIGKKD